MTARKVGPIREALNTTLGALELDFEAAAIVALCERTADLLDRVTDAATYTKLANSFMTQLDGLVLWRVVEVPDLTGDPVKDPFDELAKALSKGGNE